MSKQDQIDQLNRRIGELEAVINGDDLGSPGLRDLVTACHDQVVSLRDEVASLRRRVKDLENMTGKQAKEPEPVTSVELAVWKERAEKAEAEVADLQAQIRGVKRVLGVPMPAENSFHKGKAA